MMLAGGSEATVTELAMAGFANIGLSPITLDPARQRRPFDKDATDSSSAKAAVF